MKWLVLCLAIAGCAKAGPGNEIIGGLDDAGTEGAGRLSDGGPVDVTLSQTSSNEITPKNAIDCGGEDNAYLRVFTPRDAGVSDAFAVAEVAFGVEAASADLTATLKILPYTGAPGDTLDPARMGAPLASQAVAIAQTAVATMMRVPITATIPAGASFAVELDVPKPDDLFIGTNTGSETRPGYLLAPGCAIDVPTRMQKVADDNNIDTTVVMVMSVSGSH